MKVAIVYVYVPHAGGPYEWVYPMRFLSTYHDCPTKIEHQSVIVCNSGKVNSTMTSLFASMQNCTFLEHDNSGFDIGAFQLAARTVPCDLMVFFGASAYIRGSGWLDRMVQAYQRRGVAQYGCMGNAGDIPVHVWPHIRTTGFWLPPSLLNEYPLQVKTREQRYEFEHKANCLTEWCTRRGLHSWVVTWTGEYLRHEWDLIPNGFHRGDQSGLLTGDHISEPPMYKCA